MRKKILALFLTIIMLALPLSIPSANAAEDAAANAAANAVAMPEEEIFTKNIIMEEPEPYYYDPPLVSEESELTAAILKFKEIFGATDEYKEFYHYVSINYGKKIYDLHWIANDYNSYKAIYAGVGVDGIIYSFDIGSKWYHDYIFIPEISKDEAIDIAYDFLKIITPELVSSISKDHVETLYSTYSDMYVMTFYRVENNIVIRDEYITISVHSDGDIVNYSRYGMSNNVAKMELVKSLDKTAILNSMRKNLPFELAYQIVYPNGYDKLAEVKLVYKLDYTYRSKIFDAATGNMLHIESTTYYPQYAAATGTGVMEESVAPQSNYLTDIEIAAVKLDKTFLTVEEITKMLVDDKSFDFTSDYYVLTSRLNTNKSMFTGIETYYWSINYINKEGNSAYANVDAQTGTISSFNTYKNYYNYKYANEYEKSQEDCLPIAEKYLMELYPDIFAEYTYEPSNYITYYGSEYITNYAYNFYRYVNGIKFSDSISVYLDPETQLITSLYMYYSDAEFPSLNNIITKDTAVDRYWMKFDLKPTYVIYDKIENDTIFSSYYNISDYKKYLLLVYRYIYDYSVDAKTGKVVDYRFNELLRDNIPTENYHIKGGLTDIKNHKYEEAIAKLYNMDFIKSSNNKFKPDTYIKYEELINILAYLNRYYFVPLSGTLETYKNETVLTRSDAIKIFIEQIGYGKIANLKGIFNIDYFADRDKISENLTGYVAIAKGLGILEHFGDKISLETKITKAEAVQMVYNYIVNMTIKIN